MWRACLTPGGATGFDEKRSRAHLRQCIRLGPHTRWHPCRSRHLHVVEIHGLVPPHWTGPTGSSLRSPSKRLTKRMGR